MSKKSLAMLAGLFCLTPAAMAANYPTESFDATYQVTTGATKTQMRMASDGKGHMMTETTAAGQKYGSILDYINNTSTSLIPQGKMAMKTKLPKGGGYVGDESSVKQLGGKSLGTKVVNGHPCHGFEYTTAGAKTETWIGDDCKCVVQSTTNSTAGKSVMELKSVAGKPSDDLFKVPAGYKVMNQ